MYKFNNDIGTQHFCDKCTRMLTINNVEYRGNDVTAYLKCMGGRNHTSKIIYSRNGGATWWNEPRPNINTVWGALNATHETFSELRYRFSTMSFKEIFKLMEES